MKTICVKCAWHYDGRPNRRGLRDWCYAPWPKKLDLVTGKMKPTYVECFSQNNGICIHFKPKWYVRVWKYLLNRSINEQKP